MKIYIMVVEDRHFDVEVRPFTSRVSALKEARKAAEAGARGRMEDLEENLNEAMEKDGWIYNCIYSCEGDRVRVVMRELEEE